MKNLLILLVTAILLFAGQVMAESLEWDASIGADGYTAYFTDGTKNYNYTIIGQVNTTASFDTLHIPYGIEITYYVTAYNEAGESGPSNTVTYTRGAYVPPEDSLPDASLEPSGSDNLVVTPS